MVHRRPRELAARFDAWNDFLMRCAFERMEGPSSPVEAWLWLQTWGVDDAVLESVERSLRGVLERLIGG